MSSLLSNIEGTTAEGKLGNDHRHNNSTTLSTDTMEQNSLADRHESQEAADGKKDVRYPFAFKNLDWQEYHRYRPTYPESMWKTWLDYHKSHGGGFETAHDIGSGE